MGSCRQCNICKHRLSNDGGEVLCMGCNTKKDSSAYGQAVWHSLWKKRSLTTALCLQCIESGEACTKKFQCTRCTKKLPAVYFVSELLNACLLKDDFERLHCPTCAVGEERHERWKADAYPCITCKQDLPRSSYSAIDLKGTNSRSNSYRECEECKFPRCGTCKELAPHRSASEHKKRVLAGVKKEYMCTHCNYPPCSVCKVTPRPDHQETYNVTNIPEWKPCVQKRG